jgi:hypothetical protein
MLGKGHESILGRRKGRVCSHTRDQVCLSLLQEGSEGSKRSLSSVSLDAFVFFLFFFSVLGFELRTYILSHSTSPS